MTVVVDNLGSSGAGAPFPPKGTQLAVMVDNFIEPENPNGVINAKWRVDYIGSDAINMGLPVSINNQFDTITFTPVGVNPPPVGPFYQSGVVLTPLPLAWYTQTRATQECFITLFDCPLNQPGLFTMATLCCLSQGCQLGQCYALNAHTDGEPPRVDMDLTIQRWKFPNVPNIGSAQPPNTNWVETQLLTCGKVHPRDRILFQAIDQGASWRLIAAVIPNFIDNPGPMEIRGVVTDSVIGAGQPALAGIGFTSTNPFSMRDFVGGFGPNDKPFVP